MARYNPCMDTPTTQHLGVETSQGLITYRQAAPPSNDGPALLLIHGLGGSSAVWQRNILVLGERYRTYAVDLWGPHRSSVPSRTTPAAGVAYLMAFMDAVGVPSAHLLGSSLGGLLATRLASAEPQRVLSLSLVGSAGLGREIAWSQRLLTLPGIGKFFFRPTERRARAMLKLLIRRGAIPESLVQEIYEESKEPGVTRQMLAALRAGVSILGVKPQMLILDELRGISTPTLVMAGELDPLFPIAHPRRATELIPNSRLHIFPGAGHWPYFEDSQAFNRVLLEFLDSSPSPSPA